MGIPETDWANKIGLSLDEEHKLKGLQSQVVGPGTYEATAGLRPMTDEEKIDKLFTYQFPDPVQKVHLQEVRESAKHFAKVLLRHTPAGSDRSAAIRKLREAVMTANAAIVLNGLNF